MVESLPKRVAIAIFPLLANKLPHGECFLLRKSNKMYIEEFIANLRNGMKY